MLLQRAGTPALLHNAWFRCLRSRTMLHCNGLSSASKEAHRPVANVQPQDAYGLEKLASEELCMHYDKDFGVECRIARFHNIYGPYGTWKGGREKAPAAFCRKVRLLLTLARHRPRLYV